MPLDRSVSAGRTAGWSALLGWHRSVGSVGFCSGKRGFDEIYFKFTSFLYPGTVFKFNLKDEGGAAAVYRETEVAGFDPELYEAKQLFFDSKDGTKIPMFVIHAKGLALDGNNSCLLYGYLTLSPSHPQLLDLLL